jgi:hypothetical protein
MTFLPASFRAFVGLIWIVDWFMLSISIRFRGKVLRVWRETVPSFSIYCEIKFMNFRL